MFGAEQRQGPVDVVQGWFAGLHPEDQGVLLIAAGIALIAVVSVLGFRLRAKQIRRTNEHGVVVYESEGRAVAGEAGIGLFRGFARVAITAAIILIVLGLGIASMG